MARPTFAVIAVLVLSACVSIDNADDVPLSAPASDTCRAATGQSYIGRKASSEVGAELLRATNSRELRWVAPDMIVTADYKFGRLTVSYDEAMTITSISCG